MNKALTVMDTRGMSMAEIQLRLGEDAKELEKLGMDHRSACGFLSGVMNLGVAAQEKCHDENQTKVTES